MPHFQNEEEFQAWLTEKGLTYTGDGEDRVKPAEQLRPLLGARQQDVYGTSMRGSILSPKGSKMHNRKVKTVDGTFDSEGEYTFWLVLSRQQELDFISHLEHHKRFCICDAIDGHPDLYYVVDFFYNDCQKDVWVAHEYKGYETPLFKLKRSLFKHRYPDIDYRQTNHRGRT